MTKGTVFASNELGTTHVADRYRLLAAMLKERLGWKLIYDRFLQPNEIEGDKLLLIKSPQYSTLHNVELICSVPVDIKVIGYFADIHYPCGAERFKKAEYVYSMSKVFGRCDVILSAYKYPFMFRWSEFSDKLVFFPHFFAPESRFSELTHNEKPEMKCLVSGCRSSGVYKLREFAYGIEKELVSMLEHPGYGPIKQVATGVGPLAGRHVRNASVRRQEHEQMMSFLRGEREFFDTRFKTGDEFATEINRHFCALSDCSVYGYAVGKYMEIPAAGALLVANYTPDMDELGFIDGVNYVKVDEENLEQKLRIILNCPEKYESVRKSGRRFALEEFGIEKSFERLVEILKCV